MSNAKHTPGPWRAVPQVSSKYGRMIVEHNTGVDCVTVACNLEPQDARLIAAAPDLYDGCNALLGLLQLVCGRSDVPPEIKAILETSHRRREALAAVAKAVQS